MKVFKYLLIITVCICMAIFLYQTDFQSVFSMLQSVGYQVLLVFPLTALAYYLGTLSWQAYLSDGQNSLSSFKLFFIRQIGETVGLFNPTSIVGGDFTKIHYLRRLQIDERVAANSVISSRMTMVLSQVLLSTLALLWLLFYADPSLLPENIRQLLYLLLFLLIAIQFGLLYWINRTTADPINTTAQESPTTKMQRIKIKIMRTLSDLKISFRSDKKAFFRSYVFALLHWIVGGMEFYFILRFLGVDIAFMQSILLDMGVILIKSVGAFIPGQIGIEELGNKIMLASVGVQTVSLWISVSLLRRFRQLVWALVGCIAYVCFIRLIKPPYALH